MTEQTPHDGTCLLCPIIAIGTSWYQVQVPRANSRSKGYNEVLLEVAEIYSIMVRITYHTNHIFPSTVSSLQLKEDNATLN